jgi:hypothetical protein
MTAPEHTSRRIRAALWLFERSRTARTVFVVATFPIVWSSDRWGRYGRVDSPARLRDGLEWAKRGVR